ncbi:Hpt domain-containing protein [Lusitaniella coriacea LEGE 07167]
MGGIALDSASHQKILGYFIEEAKEHLETLEQGLMDLTSVVNDPEKINEMFRAAHSIKGGAAMLGYNSIQKTAHRLEDCFKILREQDVPVDRELENLFFKGYDTLHELLDQLEGPFGLQDEEAKNIVKAAEPDFGRLQDYLQKLVGSDTTLPGVEMPQIPQSVAPSPAETDFTVQVKAILKEMLQLFKKKSNAQNRKKIKDFCVKLAKLAPKEKGWQLLTNNAYKAISNPKFTYRTLAPIIIKEIKQGGDLIALGQGNSVEPSPDLKRLATAKVPQILIPIEPKEAAKTLKHTFNAKQISQLVQLLGVK